VTEQLRSLRNGQYAKPFVLDDGVFLQLHFSMRFTQSRMNLKSPYALTLAYTRKMMSFLLFQPHPLQVVIVGLGGGSLTKYCYRQLPCARITTIEIDQTVIDMAKLFHVPSPDARMRIVHADACQYLATTLESAEVVLVDGCDQHGIALELCDESFLATVHARLRPGGVLVMNLFGAAGHSGALIRAMAKVFDNQVLVLKVSAGGNRIAFAFAGAEWPPDWSAIKLRATQLAREHTLDFEEYARLLERSHHDGGMQPRQQTSGVSAELTQVQRSNHRIKPRARR
jgi:spermidine synthase